jgi:DNA end-binding protein Ku
MPRSVWTGSLSFGLVSIPVALFPATAPKDVRFHLFDRKGRRIRYRRVTAEDAGAPIDDPASAEEDDTASLPGRGTDEEQPTQSSTGGSRSKPVSQPPEEPETREVAYEDLVRGYEVEPGRFALLELEDIERARPSRSSTIELEDFVELDAIDPVYFEKTYYVVPRRDAANPYRLLVRALDETRRVGIGRFVLRTKPHLVAVRPAGDVLALETLFFGDEVRPAAELVPPIEGEVAPGELRLAEQLVEVLATDWDPDRYADEYREELLRIIAEKEPVGTAEPSVAATPAEGSSVEALMEALRRSVEDAKASRAGDERPRRTG